MARWLFKQEPESYSFADLVREGRTTWDGVGNALARSHLRSVKVGDCAFFYETGKVKAIVGEMRIVEAGEAPVVEAVAALPRPVSLSEIKGVAELAEWELVRLPRLSVMPTSVAQWRLVEKLARVEQK